MTIDAKQVADRDLDLACLHEHAHCAVARHLGGFGIVTIERNASGSLEEKFYVGQFRILSSMDIDALRLVGLAGTVAESFEEDPEVTAWAIVEYLEDGVIELSASDARLAAGYTEHDLEQCLSLVKSLWPEIRAEATNRARRVRTEECR